MKRFLIEVSIMLAVVILSMILALLIGSMAFFAGASVWMTRVIMILVYIVAATAVSKHYSKRDL